MAKTKSRGRIPRRGKRVEPGRPPDQVHAEAAAEITVKLEQIARSREQDQVGAARRVGNQPVSLGVDLRGAHVKDNGLILQTGLATSAEVISIHASVHPDQPDCVAIRVDGWNGHLLVILPRDRATLLVKKLEQAVDSSYARASRKSPPACDDSTEVIVDLKPRLGESRKHLPPRSKRRGRMPKGMVEATDRFLDDLAEKEAEDEGQTKS